MQDHPLRIIFINFIILALVLCVTLLDWDVLLPGVFRMLGYDYE